MSEVRSSPENKIIGTEVIGSATWLEIKELAHATVNDNVEYGVQIKYLSNTDERRKKTIRGLTRNIQAPALGRAVDKVVFFHTHPPFTEKYRFGHAKHNPLQVLPSYQSDTYLQTSGDFANTRGLLWGYEKGGYLNIATEDGVTLAIGIVALPSSDKVLSEIRKKQGLQNVFSPATWKVWTGPSAGQSFSNILEFAQEEKPLIDEKGSALVSFTDYVEGTQTYLLRLDWTLIEEMGINLDDICFGVGINTLMNRLELDQFPHEQNLDKVNKLRVKPDRDYRIQRSRIE